MTPRSRQIKSWSGALSHSIRRPATRLRIPTCSFARPAATDKEATHTPTARAPIPAPGYPSPSGTPCRVTPLVAGGAVGVMTSRKLL